MSPARARTQRRSRGAFFRQLADELPNHLPPSHRDYEAEQWGRYYKIWYGDRGLHFEVQFLQNGRLEIAFHAEADVKTNESVDVTLRRKERAIRRLLGDDPEFFSHAPRWRALREVWSGGDLRSEEAAVEAAARLAAYVVAIRPVLGRQT